MATIKIYDYSEPEKTIEFLNAGEMEENVMSFKLDLPEHKAE